jgi:hypothetical protein
VLRTLLLFFLPAGQLLSTKRCSCRWRKEGLEGIRRRLLCAIAHSPWGRVASSSTRPHEQPSYSNTKQPHPPLSSVRVCLAGRRRGQEVGHAERAERELATGAADLLSEGHSPPLCAGTALFLPATGPRRRCGCCTGLSRYASRRDLASKNPAQRLVVQLLTPSP